MKSHNAQLSIQRSISPPDKWHWKVVLPDGHFWSVSAVSFDSATAAAIDAAEAGVKSLEAAERVLDGSAEAQPDHTAKAAFKWPADHKMAVLVRDRNFVGEGLQVGIWDGQRYYIMPDGDCFERVSGSGEIDGCLAEFLTMEELAVRLRSAELNTDVLEAMHIAACHAVQLMNRSVAIASSEEGREAHRIMRVALASYADAMEYQPREDVNHVRSN